MNNESSHQAKLVTAWAAQTIALWAPHFHLHAVPAGWEVYWCDEAGNPDFSLPYTDRPLDWLQLCDLAHKIVADHL